MSVTQEIRSVSSKPSRASAATRSRQATRARLLESGRLLFAKHGLHGVTTHDIAHRAEVASGTYAGSGQRPGGSHGWLCRRAPRNHPHPFQRRHRRRRGRLRRTQPAGLDDRRRSQRTPRDGHGAA
ncbi:MAG: TetR/AcrR family transcriptional regulator [Deltaproteobacteria bacterium]|nr:TetR/AcrR family transcriptional regulator [Deltaproteobacteria bacterium]